MPAPPLQVNTNRYDPYKNLKCRVKWDGNIRRRQQGEWADEDG